MRVRQLSESELIQARQFFVRNWSVAKGVLVLPRLESSPAAAPSPSLPEPPPLPVEGERPPATFREAREEYDRRLVAAALEQSGGKINEASRRLGISRNTLKAKMRRHGL